MGCDWVWQMDCPHEGWDLEYTTRLTARCHPPRSCSHLANLSDRPLAISTYICSDRAIPSTRVCTPHKSDMQGDAGCMYFKGAVDAGEESYGQITQAPGTSKISTQFIVAVKHQIGYNSA